MTEKALIIAAFIIGGAIVAASIQARPRYALSAATNNVAWRMDTWSGQVDLCAAAYLPKGPLVTCGVTIVAPAQPQPLDPAAPPPSGIPPGAPL